MTSHPTLSQTRVRLLCEKIQSAYMFSSYLICLCVSVGWIKHGSDSVDILIKVRMNSIYIGKL